MNKEQSEVEKFLGNLESDQNESNPFEESPENPFDKGQVEEVEEVREEKALPFHKDPKVQKFIEKELNKRLENFRESEPQEREVQNVDDDYYVRLIGNDTPEKVAMIREAMARDERMLQMAEERAMGRLSQKEQEAMQADQEAEDELESAFDNIEETYDVDITSNNSSAVKTRQEFVSFVERIAPKDRNGDIIDYPDMMSAFEAFQEIKKSNQVPSRAKELANRSMARSSEATVNSQGKSNWDAADAFIESLGK